MLLKWNALVLTSGLALTACVIDDASIATKSHELDEAPANLLINASFEEPARASGWGVYSSIPGWTVASGPGIEIQVSGVVAPAVDGRQIIELDSYAPTETYQDVATKPGATYRLSLMFRKRVTDSRIDVKWNGTTLATLNSGTGWNEFSWVVTADSEQSRVGLADTSRPDSLGGLIDDVRLIALDSDGDGVLDGDDACPDTVLPESVPTERLGTNRFAIIDDSGVFSTTSPHGRGPRMSFTIEETAGCSCAQIIDNMGLGQGHIRFGCSLGALQEWVSLVNP